MRCCTRKPLRYNSPVTAKSVTRILNLNVYWRHGVRNCISRLSLRMPIACTNNKQYLNGGSGGADFGQAGIQ